MTIAKLSLWTTSATLVACGPPDDPGSATEATSTSTGPDDASTTGATPTTLTTQEDSGDSTTGDDGTDSDSAGAICGDPGQVRWIRQFDAYPDTGHNATSLAVDGAGNVILVGAFFGTADFGGETFVVTDPHSDAFVAKFDTGGNHVWSRHFGGPGEQRIDVVAVDEDGTIALGGRFSGEIDVGGGPLTSVSFMDVVVANLTPDGEHVWSRNFTSSDEFTTGLVTEIAIAGGETVLTADLQDSSDFGGGPLGLPDSLNSFVVKLDAGGGHVWSHAMGSGGPWSFESSGVAVNVAGEVWVTGRFEKEANFGGGPPVPVAETSLYVSHFTAGGQLLEVLSPASQATTHAPYASALVTDHDGRLYLGGSFSGELEFGGSTLTSTGRQDGFVVALDGGGAPLWHRAFGAGEDPAQRLFDIASDPAGRTAIAGDFETAIDFGGDVSLAGNLGVDGYVAKLDADGSPLWARALGTAQWGDASEVGIDVDGAVYVVGAFRDSLTIDGHALEEIDGYDMVLMKLCP
ncbi:hypothetical protein [Nannocystis pusilla]|uniref:hypothetical protein n=1 Tax=Nannocystis pusilla TaxID=889268 RepID=UPI003DA694F5